MKKSYLVYSGFLVVIVIVMIVAAAVQDHRTKKAQVRDSARKTLISAGATEVDDSYVPPLPSDEELLHGGEEVDLSGIPDVSDAIPQLKDQDVDGEYLFKTVGEKILRNAKFNIVSTKVKAHDAEVKVHIYYENRQGELVLEYFYYDGEWMLSNTLDDINSLQVDGKDYDELEADAYDKIVKEAGF